MATKALINTPYHEVEASLTLLSPDKQHMNINSLSPKSQNNKIGNHFVGLTGETFAQVVANATPTTPANNKNSSTPLHANHEEDDSSVHLFKDCLEAASHLNSHPLISVSVDNSEAMTQHVIAEMNHKPDLANTSVIGGTSDQLTQQEEPLLPKGSHEATTGGGGIMKRFFWKKHCSNVNKTDEKVPEMKSTTDIETKLENENFGEEGNMDKSEGPINQTTEETIAEAKPSEKMGKQHQKHFIFGVGARNVFSLRNKMNAYHSVEGDDNMLNGQDGNEMKIKREQCQNVGDGSERYQLHEAGDQQGQETNANTEGKIDKLSIFHQKKGKGNEGKDCGGKLISKFGGCKQHYIIWNGRGKKSASNNDKGDANNNSNESQIPILANVNLKTESCSSYEIQMEQIFKESSSYRSYDFVWNSSKNIYTFISLFLYRIITFVLAIPLTIVWAIIMSIMCVINVWILGPIVNFFTMWMELVQRVWGSVCKTFVAPIVEAFTVGRRDGLYATTPQCCTHACLKTPSNNPQHVVTFEEKNGGVCMTNGTDNPKQDNQDVKMYPEIVPKLV